MSTPHTLADALNQRIAEYLEEEGWSQREFARRLGVTQGAVSYLLGGKRRKSVLHYYERIADIFGVPLFLLIAELEVRVAIATREEDPELLARVRNVLLKRLPKERQRLRPELEGAPDVVSRRRIPRTGPQRPLALAIQVYINALWRHYDHVCRLLDQETENDSTHSGADGPGPVAGERTLVDALGGTDRSDRRDGSRSRRRVDAGNRWVG